MRQRWVYLQWLTRDTRGGFHDSKLGITTLLHFMTLDISIFFKSKYLNRPIKPTIYPRNPNYHLTSWRKNRYFYRKLWSKHAYNRSRYSRVFQKHQRRGWTPGIRTQILYFPKRKPTTQYSLWAFGEPHLNFPHALSQWPKIHRKNIKGLTVVKGKGRQTKPTPPHQQKVSRSCEWTWKQAIQLCSLVFFSPSFSFIVPRYEQIQWGVCGGRGSGFIVDSRGEESKAHFVSVHQALSVKF